MSDFDSGARGVGVDKVPLSVFYEDLRAALLMITGLAELPPKLARMSEERRREALFHPMFVLGLPGVGKTAGIISEVKEIGKRLPNGERIGFKKIQLGQTTVGELSGIPVVVESKIKRVTQEDLPNEERDGKYGVLFLDEITTADEMQVQPALGLADTSRSLGVYKLPENWLVVAAGNGPECSNFVRCDDALLSRFTVYDIEYDYKKDWRSWAHANDIDELILAFLNFAPEWIVKPISTDMDNNGMQFPCPRTWTALSDELAKTIRPMSNAELKAKASRVVGTEAATEFAAFALFKDKVNEIDDNLIENILNGNVFKKANQTGQPVNENMTSEMYAIILQMLVKELQHVIAEEDTSTGTFSEDCYIKVGNAYRWLLAYQTRALSSVLAAFIELTNDVPELGMITMDLATFADYCPEFDEFLAEYAGSLQGDSIDFDALRI